MKILALFLTLLAFASSPRASAQSVVVNELLASNTATLSDPDFGDFADWIELYNPASSAVDVGGYTITDDLTETARWRIPDGTTIEPGGYLILWADDEDAHPPATSALHTDFKLSAGGEQVGLYDASGAVVDTLTYGEQTTDVSFGRVPDGSDVWAFMSTPTPGAANTASSSEGIAAAPTVTLESGFYASGTSFELATTEPGGDIRYTLDGTDPMLALTTAQGPFELTKTTVLRAVTVAPDRIPSEVVTRTFFVNETTDLAVISLVTDPVGFFSDTSGIYVEGTNGITGRCRTRPVNWNQDWEREVHLSFFEPTDTGFELVMDQGAGAQIFGGCSRIYPQKSLSLHARSRYGASDFGARLFPDLDIESFDDLVLRSSAQDWFRTMFRDGMIQTLTRHMDLDGQAYRPTIVFLNGDYWGIHNLREKLNEDYVAAHYGMTDDDVELLDIGKGAFRGRSDHYDDLLSILDTQDIRQPDVMAQVAERMDIEQYLNYQVAEIYSANADWPGNNMKLWRPRTPDGRWRWMFFDLDFGFGGNAEGMSGSNTLALATAPNGPDWPNPPRSTYLFRKLLENDGFRHAFIQRMAAHINTTFAPARAIALIDSMQAGIASEMPRHTTRWTRSASFGESWESQVRIMRDFARDRPAQVRGHVGQYFSEVPGSTLLEMSSTEGGQILAEGVAMPRGTIADPFDAVFFRGVPVELVAVPDDGYVFSGWTGLVTASSDTVSVRLASAASITATFELASTDTPAAATAQTALSSIWPNPVAHTAQLEVTLAQSGPLCVRVVDMLGRTVATIVEGREAAGTKRYTLDASALPGGIYMVVMQAEGFQAARQLVVAR
ncbi:MAG: hypothetical protein Rubg2KO_21630 [Rubricoccaceae bacterium]